MEKDNDSKFSKRLVIGVGIICAIVFIVVWVIRLCLLASVGWF